MPDLVVGQSNAGNLVLKNYLIAQENSQSVNDFVVYSKQVETLVINSQEYNSQDKEYLLGNMATVRHDFHYWGID